MALYVNLPSMSPSMPPLSYELFTLLTALRLRLRLRPRRRGFRFRLDWHQFTSYYTAGIPS